MFYCKLIINELDKTIYIHSHGPLLTYTLVNKLHVNRGILSKDEVLKVLPCYILESLFQIFTKETAIGLNLDIEIRY